MKIQLVVQIRITYAYNITHLRYSINHILQFYVSEFKLIMSKGLTKLLLSLQVLSITRVSTLLMNRCHVWWSLVRQFCRLNIARHKSYVFCNNKIWVLLSSNNTRIKDINTTLICSPAGFVRRWFEKSVFSCDPYWLVLR